MLRTIGLSPKAVLAFLFPLIAAAGATVASWIVSGQFDLTEIRTAAGGVVLAGVALVGAWVGRPGEVAYAGPSHAAGNPGEDPDA